MSLLFILVQLLDHKQGTSHYYWWCKSYVFTRATLC